ARRGADTSSAGVSGPSRSPTNVLDVRVPLEAGGVGAGGDHQVVTGGPEDGGQAVRAAAAEVVEHAGGGVHVEAVDEVVAGGVAVVVDASVDGGGAAGRLLHVEDEARDDHVRALGVLDLEDAADGAGRRGGEGDSEAAGSCRHVALRMWAGRPAGGGGR